MAELEFQAVSKAYSEGAAVLSDFSLRVEDGEFAVLVGPSGCGKSTALKIAAGLEPASGGKILIAGRDVTDLGAARRDIAMVFQNYALYPHLTVRGNLAFGLKMRGASADDIARRVAAAARALGIEELLERRPRELSGGQRQRVALGRAIVRRPNAYLMDEPLSNLDAKLRGQMRAEISALHAQLGVTTLYVTHDQTEAMTMARRIVILRAGVIQQIAAPEEMYHNPANIFVAGFIGSPGMNFFAATLHTSGGAPQVETLGVRFAAEISDNEARRGDLADGRPVVAGIRPEHFSPPDGIGARAAVRINLVESLGHENIIHFVPGAGEAAVGMEKHGAESPAAGAVAKLITGAKPAAGEAVELSFPPAAVRLFHPGDGRLIGRGAQ